MEMLYNEIKNVGFFSNTLWNNSILDYTITVVLFILIYFGMKLMLEVIFFVAKNTAKSHNTLKNKSIIIDYLDKKRKNAFVPFEILVAIYFSIKFLNYSPKIESAINNVTIIFCTIFIISIIIDFIKYIIKSKYDIANENDTRANSLNLLFPIIKIIIWILATFFVLSNIGFNVSSLLAGLGIGGIAIAFASQAFLSDLLSFISIVSDKPFEIGDYISLNDLEGTVTKIGIKSVRIERNMGEEVIIPNSTITKSELHNYKKLNKRRADFVLGIKTKTPNEKLKLIPTIIQNICNEDEKIEFIRCHFSSILTHCYEFSIVYYVIANDYLIYADVRQFVNLRIKEEFEKHKIELTYPTTEIKMIQQ